MSAVDHAGQGISAGIDSSFAVRVQVGSADNLGLHSHKHILINNGFVAAFHIVLRRLTVVGAALLLQNADRVGLLKKGISDVLLVGKDLLDVALIPFLMTRTVFDAVSVLGIAQEPVVVAVQVLGFVSVPALPSDDNKSLIIGAFFYSSNRLFMLYSKKGSPLPRIPIKNIRSLFWETLYSVAFKINMVRSCNLERV